jgi:pilus assembly protein CpaB
MSPILPREPLFKGKLTKENGEGFIASIIKPGMRAFTIETKGPSSSVAGFVRPHDRVDVLVNVRGNQNDETGGGFTTTLLQSVEIIAIDRMLDPDADPLKMVEMWTKGNNLTSVTLEVTPDQAALLSLGQDYGDLSLSLRRMGDTDSAKITPTTMKDIRFLEPGLESPDEANRSLQIAKQSNQEPPIPTLIHTIRGSQRSVVPLHFQ